MREVKIVGVGLALDDVYNGGGEVMNGLVHPLDGSIARCNAVLEYVRQKSYVLFRLYLSAGFSKKCPAEAVGARQVSLAKQLYNYFYLQNDDCTGKICIPGYVWGTEPEIVSAIAEARRSFVTRDDKVTLVIATNWAHIPRVLLYSMRHKPIEWKLKLLVAKHHFSLLSTIREAPAFLVELVKSMFI